MAIYEKDKEFQKVKGYPVLWKEVLTPISPPSLLQETPSSSKDELPVSNSITLINFNSIKKTNEIEFDDMLKSLVDVTLLGIGYREPEAVANERMLSSTLLP